MTCYNYEYNVDTCLRVPERKFLSCRGIKIDADRLLHLTSKIPKDFEINPLSESLISFFRVIISISTDLIKQIVFYYENYPLYTITAAAPMVRITLRRCLNIAGPIIFARAAAIAEIESEERIVL